MKLLMLEGRLMTNTEINKRIAELEEELTLNRRFFHKNGYEVIRDKIDSVLSNQASEAK